AKLGGLSRTSRSREYLFSGLIYCGLCDRSISITDGSGDDGRYGCATHRYKGACANDLTIRRRSLEQQLLGWLTRDLLQGDRLEQVLVTFQALVQERVAELQVEANKNAIHMPELRKELEQKKRDACGIADVIAMMGRNSSPILLSRLQAFELRIREIEELLARAKEPEPMVAFSDDETKEYWVGKLRDVQTVFNNSPQLC